jgi:hypothetical protein
MIARVKKQETGKQGSACVDNAEERGTDGLFVKVDPSVTSGSGGGRIPMGRICK